LGGGLTDSQAKLDRKTRELELADMVIVPSQFVADSLPAWARATKRVVISPFGSPEAAQAADGKAETGKRSEEKAETGKLKAEEGKTAVGNAEDRNFQLSAFSSQLSPKRLRVLFAGSMGQRKGLGDLMAAVRMLDRPDVELVCMGSLMAPMQFYQRQCPGFTYEKGRPHAQVLELMRSCDVFCLPSIVEGRALVMQEAMSQGLPIIITPNTGGEELVCEAGQIRRGETGKLKAEVGKAETGRSAKRVEGQSSAIDPAGMSNSGAQRAEVDTK